MQVETSFLLASTAVLFCCFFVFSFAVQCKAEMKQINVVAIFG